MYSSISLSISFLIPCIYIKIHMSQHSHQSPSGIKSVRIQTPKKRKYVRILDYATAAPNVRWPTGGRKRLHLSSINWTQGLLILSMAFFRGVTDGRVVYFM